MTYITYDIIAAAGMLILLALAAWYDIHGAEVPDKLTSHMLSLGATLRSFMSAGSLRVSAFYACFRCWLGFRFLTKKHDNMI